MSLSFAKYCEFRLIGPSPPPSQLNAKTCPNLPQFPPSLFFFLPLIFDVKCALYEILSNIGIIIQKTPQSYRLWNKTLHSLVYTISLFLPDGEHEMESERDAFQHSIKMTPFPPGPICLQANPQIPFKEVRGQCQTQPKAFCNVFTWSDVFCGLICVLSNKLVRYEHLQMYRSE